MGLAHGAEALLFWYVANEIKTSVDRLAQGAVTLCDCSLHILLVIT